MDSITDEEFFTSNGFKGFMTDIVENITRRYKYNEKVLFICKWDKNADEIAYTDNHVIVVNGGCDFVQSYQSRAARFRVIRGLVLHEVGHLLYTDFPILNKIMKYMEKGEVYNTPLPLTDEMKEFQELLHGVYNPQILMIIYKLFHDLNNAFEDAHVNARVGRRFPGYKGDLDTVLSLHQDNGASLKELKKKEEKVEDIYYSVAEMLHQYALFAECKCENWQWNDRRMVCVSNCMELVDEAILTDESKSRTSLHLEVFAALLPLYEQYIEELKERLGNDPSSPQNNSVNEEISKQLEQLTQGSKPTSNHSSSPSKEASKNSSSEQKVSNHSSAATSDQESDANKECANDTGAKGATVDAGEERSRAIDREAESIPCTKREPLSSAIEKTVQKNAGYDRILEDTNRIMKTMATEKVAVAKEIERTNELNDFAASISQPEIYNGFGCSIERLPCVDDQLREAHKHVSQITLPIAKKMAKSFQKIIAKKQKGEKITGLYTGRRIEIRTIPRNNGKYFSKKTLPTNHPTLSVAYLGDESGSMSGCDRITYSRMSALLLYEFCQILGIPVGIFGHTTQGGKIIVHSYAEFQSIDKNDKYRILNMNSYGGNMDGYALRFVSERILAEAKADIMLLIIASDGQPNGGRAACEDVASVVKEYRKKGIITIAAAIGDDKDTIEAIYKDNYLSISNIEKLPEKLVGLVRPYIK